MKKSFALVGTGGRAALFLEGIAATYRDTARLTSICDISQVRMRYHNDRLKSLWGLDPVPAYASCDFQRMLDEHRPDAVIVTSMDCTHDDYIVQALEHGSDAITEKPMAINPAKCRRILQAAEETGRDVRVCFNYRWQAAPTRIKRLLSEGAIGTVRSVMMEYALDTSHGADYFRRWHSEKDKSGGLLVHKATHHFDLVNWWIDSIPKEVFAWGDLVFYGKKNAVARGDERFTGYDRYTDQNYGTDPFALDLKKAGLQELYYDAEAETGYLRDRNVFRDGITIEDTMAVLVKYRTGVVLTYCLNAFSPIEGYRVVFHGDRGRIEYAQYGPSAIIKGHGDAEAEAEQHGAGFETLRVMPHFQPGYDVEIPFQPGGHGGGDPLLVQQLFSADPPEEKLGRLAGCEQGAASIIVGAAANLAMETGKPVRIDELIALRPEAVHLSELKR